MTVGGATDPAFLAWLVGAVVAYWLAPGTIRTEVLVAVTAAFLAFADPLSLAVLSALAAVVFVATHRRGANRGAWLVGAMGLVAVVLFAFKAYDPERGVVAGGVAIPLGLSFYTLRCLHLLIECYLDELPPPPPRQLLAYLFFLPTSVAGPVHRYPPFVAQTPPTIDRRRISLAAERILYGYVMIVVVSDYLLTARLFPYLKSRVAATGAAFQYLDCLDFGLNLYFQFTGYSEVAIAFSLLLGKEVMENFDRPLLRTNVIEFWRTWHMSVTSWCREYVFTGVFALARQRWLGMVATMLAIGLWHGLTLNFVAWGLYHGLGIVVTQLWTQNVLRRRHLSGAATLMVGLAGWFVTFNFVMLGFAWTKEPTLAASFAVFRIFLMGGGA